MFDASQFGSTGYAFRFHSGGYAISRTTRAYQPSVAQEIEQLGNAVVRRRPAQIDIVKISDVDAAEDDPD